MFERTLLTCKTHWEWTLAAAILLVCAAHAAPFGKPENFPCYERDVQPLIAMRCGECHTYNAETLLHTYDRAKSQSYAVYRDAMAGNMPMAKRLPTEEASVFKAWHEKGAPRCVEAPVKKP